MNEVNINFEFDYEADRALEIEVEYQRDIIFDYEGGEEE